MRRGGNEKNDRDREQQRGTGDPKASSRDTEPYLDRYPQQQQQEEHRQHRERRRESHSDDLAEQNSRVRRRTETSFEAGARSDATSDDENLPRPKQQRKLIDRINRVLNWL